MMGSFRVSLAVLGAVRAAVPTLESWDTNASDVQVCGLPVPPGAADCPGGPFADAGLCSHARCCWTAEGRCVETWTASRGGSAEGTVQYYGGDQAAVQLDALRGGLGIATDDVAAVTGISFPPFFQSSGSGVSTGAIPSNLTIGGARPTLETQRWRPHEIIRTGGVVAGGSTLDVESHVRFGYNDSVVFIRMDFANTGADAVETSVEFDLVAEVQWFSPTGWEWGHPGPSLGEGPYEVTVANASRVRSCDGRPLRPQLFLEDCDAGDPRHRWSGAALSREGTASTLENDARKECLGNSSAQPLMMGDCGPGAGTFERVNGSLVARPSGLCLDAIHGFRYTDVGEYGCHGAESPDWPHQQFSYDATTRLIKNAATGQCVATSKAAPLRACTGVALGAQETPCVISAQADGKARATCRLSLVGESSAWIGLAVKVGLDDDATAVEDAAWAAATNFQLSFDVAQSDMEAWWQSFFRVDGGHYPGVLPTLETEDAALSRTYYGSLLSFAAVALEAPSDRGDYTAYRSVGASAGITALYMWDTGYSADIWALLDAPSVAEVASLFATRADLDKNNVLDVLTRRGAGKYYAFSRYAAFLTLRAAVALGDFDAAFAARAADWMDGLATAFSRLPQLRPGLADYGASPDGFLECVPTYVHGVAALAAANTWMLRETAALRRAAGNATRAADLEALAETTSAAALGLMDDTRGFFHAAYPDNTTVPVRTCLDFIHVGTSMAQDLDAGAKAAMVAFFDSELRTPDWMRALSLKDAAANESDRADHGPRGAWDGWVGLSAVALGNLGDYEAAAELLRAAGTVLDEGPYGQAHRVYGDNNTKMVRPPRKGGDQAYLATCGVTLASAIVRSLFGFEPPVAGATNASDLLKDAHVPRGFDGVLRNVRYRGALYDITSRRAAGLSIAEARP